MFEGTSNLVFPRTFATVLMWPILQRDLMFASSVGFRDDVAVRSFLRVVIIRPATAVRVYARSFGGNGVTPRTRHRFQRADILLMRVANL